MINKKNLKIKSPGIVNGKFKTEHTGYDKDLSPAFYIENLSPKAKSLVLTLEDLSHPIKNFTHWTIWNVPATSFIGAGIPSGKTVGSLNNSVQGIGYGLHKYAGPKPPKEKKHEYRFTVYALDSFLDLGPNTMKRKLLKEVGKHCIQKGTLTASYVKE